MEIYLQHLFHVAAFFTLSVGHIFVNHIFRNTVEYHNSYKDLVKLYNIR